MSAVNSKLPPSDIEPTDLWSQLTALPRAHRVVPFPRMDSDGVPLGNVAIAVLDSDEIMLSNLNAEKYAREQYKKIVGSYPSATETSASYSEAFNSRAAREMLFRSCKKSDQCLPDFRGVCVTDHDKLLNFFPTLDAVGKLAVNEQAVLVRHYMRTQSEVGPLVSNMSEAEKEAWVEVLAKGGSAAPLALLSSDQASDLLMYMACRLYVCPTDNSSLGSPHDEQ